jgi:hypothetical protein
MIKNELQQHWEMCRALRLHKAPELRQPAARYFAAKKRTDLPTALEVKAVGYVTEFGTIPSAQAKL